MNLQTRVASAFASLLIKRPGTIALSLLLLVAVSAYAAATRLTINTNQLDLISQELRQVHDVKRVVDMVGGVGHLIITLRSDDEQALKAVADDLAAELEADKENVRTLTYKISTDFVRERAALFMKTEDLLELKRRVTEKLQDTVRRASPFFFEIVPTPEVELKYDDIVDKYLSVGKKSIVDDYYISLDRKMLILIVKPMWNTSELEKTGAFRGVLLERLAKYSQANRHGLTLVEDYSGTPSPDKSVVQFGFTGSYIHQYEDSYAIKNSLKPVSGVALAGVIVVLLAFFRRRIGSVALVVSGLLFGIALSFGFATAAIGELNMITSILGGILMGTGIDFGIFLVYRLREELLKHGDVPTAVREAVTHAGPASFVSAAGTGAAFLSLLFSDFRGFSQFGLLAGVGVFIIGISMYSWVPAAFLLLDRHWPKLARRLLVGNANAAAAAAAAAAPRARRIPMPGVLLGGALVVTLGVATFGSRVKFDYDSRALMVENQPSLALQDELNDRFQMSADPVAIYSKNLEEARQVYDVLTGPDAKERFSTVDQAVSIYTFVPPREQQEANAKILAEWKEELSAIDKSVLPPEYAGRWDEAMSYLEARPYGVDDVPLLYRELFLHLPTTRPENHGYLTFLYPQVDLWNGENVLKFAEQVEDIVTPEGKTYNSAGLAILMATLAKIVLNDAKMFVVLTAVLLLLILLVDFGSLKSALVGLLPLGLGVGGMLGLMGLQGSDLNFMNIVVFPIILGYGVSVGVYFLHRFREGTSPRDALRSVGAPVACSTLTTLVGWAALLVAAHRGLKTMGNLACFGMAATLVVSFTVMPAVLQLMDDRRRRREPPSAPPVEMPPQDEAAARERAIA